MLLPFVREIFAEVEQLPAFRRASSHLRESTGRISVTGLSPAAKALIAVLLQRRTGAPFHPGRRRQPRRRRPAARPRCLRRTHRRRRSRLHRQPSRPRRASVPESLAASRNSGRARHRPLEDCHRPRLHRHLAGDAPPPFSSARPTTTPTSRAFSAAARPSTSKSFSSTSTPSATPRPTSSKCPASTPPAAAFSTSTRPKPTVLSASNFSATRSSPCASSIPASQRSSNPVDEVVLLPLTETPINEELLGSINARLSGKRIEGIARGDRASRPRFRRRSLPRLGVLRPGSRSRPHHLLPAPRSPRNSRRTRSARAGTGQSLGPHRRSPRAQRNRQPRPPRRSLPDA